jgi:hypothetical protein
MKNMFYIYIYIYTNIEAERVKNKACFALQRERERERERRVWWVLLIAIETRGFRGNKVGDFAAFFGQRSLWVR